jgi:hypothetical protein
MAEDSPRPRNVYIDEERWVWLKQQADKAKVTISQALRDCIDLSRWEVESEGDSK